MTSDHDSKSPGTKEPPPSAATRAYRAITLQMHIDMEVDYTDKADKDFSRLMAAHHKAAVEMAKVQLQYGTDPEMRKLAQKIVAENDKEIATLRAWQAKHK